MRSFLLDITDKCKEIDKAEFVQSYGKITKVIGLIVEGNGLIASIGELCSIYTKNSKKPVMAEVVGFKENRILLMPLGDITGIGPGTEILATGRSLRVSVSNGLLGRIINGLGSPIDGKGDIKVEELYPIYNSPPLPLERKRIETPIATGIRAIDCFLTCGRGQRIGIFSGSGVGKSVLLGMIARNTEADINVIALVGERGREVKEFIEKDLGEEGLKRSVVVAATSDEPPLIRRQAALIATTIAEYFRDKSKDVMLMMDSVTRFAMAQREIGLTIGEPPATKGYPPSVFSLLPKLLERAGTTSHRGSITGLYTILIEGDDMNEPISDAVRAILDGHIVLSRSMAAKNHYPPIDIMSSVSRLMVDIVDSGHYNMAARIKEILAIYRESEDLINIGAYVSGSSKKVDNAMKWIDKINEFLIQSINEEAPYEESLKRLNNFFDMEK